MTKDRYNPSVTFVKSTEYKRLSPQTTKTFTYTYQ